MMRAVQASFFSRIGIFYFENVKPRFHLPRGGQQSSVYWLPLPFALRSQTPMFLLLQAPEFLLPGRA